MFDKNEWAEFQLPTQRNKLLWVMNVCWKGGTGLWALECIREMPIWQHTVVWLNGEPDISVHNEFLEAGVDIAKVDNITKDLVKEIKPSGIILSNTDPSRILEGQEWLTSNFNVVYVHHSTVRPWLAGAAVDVFVSEHLRTQYRNLESRMRSVLVCPPIGEIGRYLNIRRVEQARCVVGRISSDNKDKFPVEQLEILKATGCPCLVVGGEKYWGAPPDNFQYPDFGSQSVSSLLSQIDIFVYRTNLTETWGRTITEAMASGIPVVCEKRGGPAEQIRHGIDGFLCDTDAEFIEKIQLLATDQNLRFRMGKHAREKAKQLANSNFKNKIEPILIKNALRG